MKYKKHKIRFAGSFILVILFAAFWLKIDFTVSSDTNSTLKGRSCQQTRAAGEGDSFLRGVSFTAFSEFAFHSAFANQSLAQFKDDGGEWIALCFWWFVDDLTATNIHADFDEYSCRNETLLRAIARARELGLKLMLKPMIDPKSGEWRAYIEPSEKWFTAYKKFIVSWAKFAEQYSIELFSVGCEFSLTESYANNWREIIAAVRQVYSGNLTYASNFDVYDKVTWWDAVDFIGIDAYFSLSNENNPSLETLIASWENIKQELQAFSSSLQKTIIFTEVGYRSINGCNKEPWNWERDARVDLEEQAMCYEALFRALWGENWLQGLFWWDWTPYNSSNWLKDKGYTCQFKPAEVVLRAWYTVSFSVTPNFSTSYNLSSPLFLLPFIIFLVVKEVTTKTHKRSGEDKEKLKEKKKD